MDGDTRGPLTDDNLATCPGRGAYIARRWDGLVIGEICADPKTHGPEQDDEPTD